MCFLLDTNIVANPACAISSIVWHEIVWGCARLPKGKLRARFEDYDEPAATWHAAERARLDEPRDRGRPTPFADGQIAAVAAVNGLVLVTQNRKDFDRFAGLHVADGSS